MPSFSKSNTLRAPFEPGHEYLRSTRDVKKDSYLMSMDLIPTVTIDGYTDQKVLSPGTIIAKATSGPQSGKFGVFDRGVAGGAAAVNETQSLTRTSTGGTVTLAFDGETSGTIPADAVGFTAAAVQAALLALSNVNPGDVTVTGVAGGPLTVTFAGQYAAQDVPLIVVNNGSATGGTVVAAQVAAGSSAAAGSGAATDGRGDYANIVGIADTYLPWQLMEHDEPIAVTYEAAVVQAWCFEYANSVRIALTNATRDAMAALPNLAILFR